MARMILGTAAFGAYAQQDALSPQLRRDLVHAALNSGVRTFDTAPTYGDAETSLGWLLAGIPDVTIATKVTPPQKKLSETALRAEILLSLDTSAQRLRQRLKIVQVHNYSSESFMAQRTLDVLLDLQHTIGFSGVIGATVYSPEDAYAAAARGAKLVQLPYNLLDQRARTSGFFDRMRTTYPEVSIWVRSVWLRGELTSPTHWTARRLCTRDLPGTALRFAAQSGASLVLGVRHVGELDTALSAMKRPSLNIMQRVLARTCAQSDPQQYDPRTWSLT